jgi:hypothetical protein
MPTYLPHALFLAVAVILADTGRAYAYLDPGTGSIILQAIIGGLAMAAVTARLYWHKILVFFGRRPAESGSGENSDAR